MTEPRAVERTQPDYVAYRERREALTREIAQLDHNYEQALRKYNQSPEWQKIAQEAFERSAHLPED